MIHLAILTLSWNNQTKCHSQKISNPTKDYKLCNCSWLRKIENRNYQFSAWNEHTAIFWEVHISTPFPVSHLWSQLWQMECLPKILQSNLDWPQKQPLSSSKSNFSLISKLFSQNTVAWKYLQNSLGQKSKPCFSLNPVSVIASVQLCVFYIHVSQNPSSNSNL